MGNAVVLSEIEPLRLQTRRQAPAVNLVVPDASPASLFAGVRTAVEIAGGLARLKGLKLRVISLARDAPLLRHGKALSSLLQVANVTVDSIVSAGAGLRVKVSPDDIFLCTYWTTAHVLDALCTKGQVDRSAVVYLVQDYEPAFHAWSDAFVVAQSTYHAGFHTVVNSKPVADHLRYTEQIAIHDELIFAPALDLNRLRHAFESRSDQTDCQSRPVLLFYARPSKPRNLYELGAAALTSATQRLVARGICPQIISAGEKHPAIPVAGVPVKSLGRVTWDHYYHLLSRASVGLSLMQSPHPSHPPLEIAAAGAVCVTNDFMGKRLEVHENLRVTQTRLEPLVEAIVEACLRTRDVGSSVFVPPNLGAFGRPSQEVVESLTAFV